MLSQQANSAIIEYGGNDGFLDQRAFSNWLTQSQLGRYHIAFLSRLRPVPYAFGSNRSGQLGLGSDDVHQNVPVPVLDLENVQVEQIATSNVQTLMIIQEGQAVLSCGSGVCGLLGVNSLQPTCRPQMIDNEFWKVTADWDGCEVVGMTLPLKPNSNPRVVSVACGARHCCAVTDSGHVFSWGSADFGQLGVDLSEVSHNHATHPVHTGEDPRTGLPFQYAARPVLVNKLAKDGVHVVTAGCTRFSTTVLSSEGRLFSWGNNTDGECGVPLRSTPHTVVYVDPNIHRTQLQVLLEPAHVDGMEPHRILEFGFKKNYLLQADLNSKNKPNCSRFKFKK